MAVMGVLNKPKFESLDAPFQYNISVAEPSEQGLFHYVVSGNLDKVQFYLEQGLDVNSRDVNRNTPLMVAIHFNHRHIVEHLLEAGANVKVSNNNGFTPLMWAVAREDFSLVESLLQQNARKNIQANNGETPLMLAVQKHNLNLVRLLLKHGANPNIPNFDGWTPLMFAVSNRELDIVKVLLANGASTLLKNKEGQTAKDLVTMSEHPVIANALRVASPVEGVSKPHIKENAQLGHSKTMSQRWRMRARR